MIKSEKEELTSILLYQKQKLDKAKIALRRAELEVTEQYFAVLYHGNMIKKLEGFLAEGE